MRNRKNKTFYQNIAILAISSFDLLQRSTVLLCSLAGYNTKMNILGQSESHYPILCHTAQLERIETLTVPLVAKKQCMWLLCRKRPNKGERNERGRVTLIKLPVLEMPGVHSRTRVKKTEVPDTIDIAALNSQIVPTVGGIDGVNFKP